MPSLQTNIAEVFESLATAIPDRECIVFRDLRLTYAQVQDRCHQLANVLTDAGLGVQTERGELASHEIGQDALALYLHNGNEYLEGMIGAYMARTAPFNVNYRYVAEELLYLLRDSGARAIIYHSAFAPTLAAVLPQLPHLTVLLQVDDDSGNALLDGARWYEAALADASTDLDPALRASWSPDDLYILYTGGTTGMPKGVMWRQADIYVSSLGGRPFGAPEEWESVDALVAAAAAANPTKTVPAPPFMHGAAHWAAFTAFSNGGTVVVTDVVDRFDAPSVVDLLAREQANVLLLVGDAFARPLLDAVDASAASGKPADLSALFVLTSGGAILSAPIKERLLESLPNIMLIDGLGSSETGTQAGQVSSAGGDVSTGRFSPHPGMVVLNEDLTRVLEPGDDEMGWLGQRNRVPLGYLGDEAKTARTFPELDGVRYAVPGDRSRILADGTLELYGRDSVTINSGGEKIFAEEVEQAISAHPGVIDVVVCGRPSERWGNEVVAIVKLTEGASATEDELLTEAAKHVARYKLPKAIVWRDEIVRSPAGKADYRWAKAQATEG
ncbi:MAG: acyl-CoA synthetase [Candidatus Microthrix parvicella]|mgnify:FL=1|uniref:acyl-CoA synthetase n=1 Tax=Candidatus Neomicrothrix TaxID=41949 RepID=UPI000362C82E|nr:MULTISPECIES: acyl-CoA synthetase [Microthrix]MBP6134196.1 acyl-CoA synthetase [Candidatus Microthrix sp.]